MVKKIVALIMVLVVLISQNVSVVKANASYKENTRNTCIKLKCSNEYLELKGNSIELSSTVNKKKSIWNIEVVDRLFFVISNNQNGARIEICENGEDI